MFDVDPDEESYFDQMTPACKQCGSTDVRWRQQGGRWVLFSNQPGVVHTCPINDDAFGVIPE